MKKVKQAESAQNTNQYGAFELKRVYKKYMTRGLIFAASLHLFVAAGIMASVYFNNLNAEKKEDYHVTEIIWELPPEEIPPVVEEQQPEEPEAPTKVVPLKDLSALIPKPVKRTEVTEDVKIKTQEELDRIKNTNVSSNGDENAGNNNYTGKIDIKDRTIEENIEKDPPIKDKTPPVFEPFQVSKAPVVVNLGEVQSSMRYPETARDKGEEGKVSVRVLVGTDGSVIKVGSLTGPSVFHSEVKSRVRDLQFTPAMNNGELVKCWITVPFNFKLKSGF